MGYTHSRQGFDSHYGRDPREVEAAIAAMDQIVTQFYAYLDANGIGTLELPVHSLSVLHAHSTGDLPGDREIRSLKTKLQALQKSALR